MEGKKIILISASLGIVLVIAYMLLLLPNTITGQVILDDQDTIRIGYKANANYLPLFVALEKGFFEDEGINVEIFRFDSTNTLMDSFAAGKIDATPTGNVIVSYSLENAQSGLFKMYSFAFYTDERHPESFIVKKDSGIQDYSDLEGKNIGVNKGIFSRTMSKKFLEQKGVTGFNIVELGSSVQIQALESGQIDALLSLEPFPTIAIQQGIAEYLDDGSIYAKTVGFSPSFSGGVISTELLEKRPEESKKFLNAMEKSLDFISDNYEESKAILPKYISIDAEIARKISVPEYYFIEDLTEEQEEAIQKTADFLYSQGILKEEILIEKLLLV